MKILKIDNIYDLTMSDVAKNPIVDDLSRIFGLVPGKNGDVLPDRVLGLTDADPDGYSIRAGIVVLVACLFPQIIEEGRLYMVEPPLFSFKDNGTKKYVTTNREYITYLQKRFSKDNSVYRNGNKMDDSQLFDFLLRNERYLEYLKNCADDNVCSTEFTELIISNLQRLGIEKDSMSKWDKLVKKNFSSQLNTEWNEGRIVISGIHDRKYEMIELDNDLLESKKTRKLLNLMNSNLGVIYGYDIEGLNKDEDISLSKILTYFSSYKAKDLKRYKGLGEMDVDDLRNTCMDLKNQRSIQITAKDVKQASLQLAMWHSKKVNAREFRKKYMMNYIPDIQDIST